MAVDRVLELGSGGGNNASHLSKHFRMTLVDRSPGMVQVSRRLNPDCEHRLGDMRTVRLGRVFDAVFVHDALDYLTTLEDLEATVRTAFVHCRPGGAVLLVPDDTEETFAPSTEHGGHDGEGRSLRYLAWTGDPVDGTYFVDFAYLLREGGEVAVMHDRHRCGLFGRAEWLRILERVGFEAGHREVTLSDGEVLQLFLGLRL